MAYAEFKIRLRSMRWWVEEEEGCIYLLPYYAVSLPRVFVIGRNSRIYEHVRATGSMLRRHDVNSFHEQTTVNY